MKGLIRNNFYAALESAKWTVAALLAFGIVAVGIGRSTPLIIFSLLCILGFSFNAIACLRKESASQWNKYKLTMPVRRNEIVKSHFISQLVWMISGITLAGVCIGSSILFHGFIFDVGMDILTIFTCGISISLFMGAIFYPLFYLGGEERNEAAIVISLVCSIGIFVGLVYLANFAFGFNRQIEWLLIIMTTVVVVSILAFTLSYFVTAGIVRKKEF